MDRIARASTDERRLVFEAAAQRMALAPAVVEKDFWVCYTLDHLFHRSGFAESMVFKGGTSLSKAFGLIERFSEDIDLILDWRLLGYGEDEPWEPRSNSAQERFKADSIERTNAFLADAFVPKWIGYIFLDDFGRTKPAFLNSTGVMYPSVECILKLLYQCT